MAFLLKKNKDFKTAIKYSCIIILEKKKKTF